MIPLVQALQALSGIAWLVPAVFLSPRIAASWRVGASPTVMHSAPIGFVCWLMVGFTVRWLAWPQSLLGMDGVELVTWAALYALSGFLALWIMGGALRTRGQ